MKLIHAPPGLPPVGFVGALSTLALDPEQIEIEARDDTLVPTVQPLRLAD